MRFKQVVVGFLSSVFLVALAGMPCMAASGAYKARVTPTKVPKSSSGSSASQKTAEASIQPSATKTAEAAPKARVKPEVSPTATPAGTSTPVVDAALYKSAADAFAAMKYMEALGLYQEYVKKNGATPEVEQKIALAKFFAGKELQNESRESLRELKRKNHLKRTAHNIMRYGKEQPARSAHPVVLSLCLLTPVLLGVDLGYTYKGHLNLGMGYGPLMNIYNPRLKYYFKGDVASFFLGVGYAKYSLHVSTSSNGDSEIFGQKVDGSASGGVKGSFKYISFGPSLQSRDGCFMEFELDFGVAKFYGAGKATGHAIDSNGNISTDDQSTDGKFDYNGPMGMIGVRWGWAF